MTQLTPLDDGILQTEFGDYKHYVYVLLDLSLTEPEVFYVGKGKNKRLEDHEAEANRSIDFENHPKLKRIRELKEREAASNPKVTLFQARIIGRYQSDEEAKAVEATLIKFVYGRSQLTNKVHGTHHMMIRDCNHWDSIEGIDLPQRLDRYLRDGQYTAHQRQQIIQNNILEKLYLLKEAVEESDLPVQVSDPDLSRAQDPLLRITWQGGDVRLALKVQLTGKTVTVMVLPNSREPHDIDVFRQRLELANAKRPDDERNIYSWDPRSGSLGPYCLTRNYTNKNAQFRDPCLKGFSLERTDLLLNEIRNVLQYLEA